MNLIAIDFETHLISEENGMFPKPVCLTVYDGIDAKIYKNEMEQVLRSLLADKDTYIIAHNAVFECGVIYEHFPQLRELMFDALDSGRIICTQHQEQLLNNVREHPIHKFSLADLVLQYFKEDISASKKGDDVWRLRYSELEHLNLVDWPKEAIQYALDDSIWALKVYMQQAQIDGTLALRSAVYLNIVANKGMCVVPERVQKLKDEVLTILAPEYKYLIGLGYCQEGGKTGVKKCTKKFREYLLGLNISLQHTKKGGIQVGAEALESYSTQTDDPIIKAFSKIAEYEKVLTAYISRLLGNTKIRTQYSTTKSTARTSSRGSDLFPSLNIQQMPRKVENVTYDIRNCFIPREGMKIVSIDYAGLELCSVAHQLYTVYGTSKMRDLLNSGTSPVDMHSMLGAQVKKITYEEFLAGKKTIYEADRQLVKEINLGFPGGLGYDTTRHILWSKGITTYYEVIKTDKFKNNLIGLWLKLKNEFPDLRIARIGKYEWAIVKDELVKLKREFFDLYPELEKFLKDTHKKYIPNPNRTKNVKNEYGEWEKEPMYKYDIYGFQRDWSTYTAFCNGFLMQTPSAIGFKTTLCNIIRKYHAHPDINILAEIHDELLFEVRELRIDIIDDIASMMIDGMQQTAMPSVRVTVEASMMDYWSKGDGFWTKTYFKDALI